QLKTTLEEFSAQQELVAAISTRLVPTRKFFSALVNAPVPSPGIPALVIKADAITAGSIDAVVRQLREIEDKVDNGDERNWEILRVRFVMVAGETRLLPDLNITQDGFIPCD